MENNIFGSLQNNLGAKIQKIKKCAGLGGVMAVRVSVSRCGGAFAVPGSKGMESKIRDSL